MEFVYCLTYPHIPKLTDLNSTKYSPLTSRLCIGTNIKESIFMSYGGFRGSVGIGESLHMNIETN